MGLFESAFDILYLISVMVLSSLILIRGRRNKERAVIIFGLMGLLLGFGDSFHLVPRIIGHLTTGLEDYQSYLGFGKLITSISMTFFYILLFFVYEEKEGKKQNLRYTLYGLTLIRFIILALPGNEWIANTSPLSYGIYRNIPFLIMGVLIVVEFFKSGNKTFKDIAIWIIVSFVCYSIVVVGAGFIAPLGAFMMPKTVAYLIMIYIGYKQL